MKDVKAFARAGAAAVEELLKYIDADTKMKIAQAHAAGSRLSLSFVVDPNGDSAVILSLVGLDGSQRSIITCNARNMTLQ